MKRWSAIVVCLGMAVGLGLLRPWGEPGGPPPAPVLQIAQQARPAFSPTVRVNLTPHAVESVQIAADGPYRLQPVGSTQVFDSGDRLGAVQVTVTATGFRIGQKSVPVSRVEIVAETSPAIWVGDHQYRGTVRLFRRPNGKLLAVNAVPLEEYIASVIDSEMPAAFPLAARQAQAIVARTYALYQMQLSRNHRFFDLYATTRSQKYLGYQYRDSSGRRLAGESEASRRIARQTQGMVCTYRGRLFCTYYSAVCGGRTLRGTEMFSDAAPPLQSVECDWCQPASRYRWQAELSKQSDQPGLKRLFAARQQPFDRLTSLSEAEPAGPGRMAMFLVGDGRHQYRVRGDELRQRLTGARLHSPHFRVRETQRAWVLEGRGHGHGVGLCQWGARGMGLAGRGCLQILNHYYPGTQVVALTASPE